MFTAICILEYVFREIVILDDIKELKVSKSTEPKKLAGTINYYIQKGTDCSLLALGSRPICIAVKSIALLTSMFSIKYQCNISYFHQVIDGEKLSGIQFTVKSI